MTHLDEEQLVLHYYGEEGDTLAAEQHLEGCGACRELYGSLQRVLNVVNSLPIPERGAEYGAQVWQRIERQMPARRRRFALPPVWRWATAGAVFASLLVVAFLAGRFYPQSSKPTQLASADPQAGQRILLVAVGDYLERSQMVLFELVNANPKQTLDISAEQERAADLVSESRLYRQTAEHTGDTAVAGVLDDLDRVLLEIAHAPSQLTPGDLQKLRQRLEAEGILFKIRVLGSNVRNQEDSASDAAPSAGRQKL
jgi:extradiol dioxygenase family protein